MKTLYFITLSFLIMLGGCSKSDAPTPVEIPGPLQKEFEDVSIAVGLEQQFGRGAGEYGALWADLDGDGWLDLVFMNHGQRPSLYANQQGQRFVDTISDSGLKLDRWDYPQQGDRHGANCADYDNDGDIDLFIAHGAMRGETAGIKSDELLNNDGSGKFRDVALDAGVPNTEGRARLGTWADYDNDGWLDLYIGNFKSPNVLYRSNRDGTFSDVTEEMNAGVTGPSPAWADYDLDGDADVLVAWTLNLLRNPGLAPFDNVTKSAGLSQLPGTLYPYSLAWGDADNDGDLDLAFSSPNPRNAVYLNENGRFVLSEFFDLGEGERTAGTTWGDVDNDGDLDLFFASSHKVRLFINLGLGQFAEPLELFEHATIIEAGGEIALGDFDRDGFLDVALDTSEKHVLLRNTRSANSWLQIRLVGTESNRSGFGAKVWVQPATAAGTDALQFREYWGDNGIYHSVGCGPLHFGLGDASRITLRILWPSGRETHLSDVSANQFLEIVEPGGA